MSVILLLLSLPLVHFFLLRKLSTQKQKQNKSDKNTEQE